MATSLYPMKALVVAVVCLLTPMQADAQAIDDIRNVCRATVAALMGDSPSIVIVTNFSKDVVSTQYVRPSDGKIWKNKCQVTGPRVVWGTDTGRWRNGPYDERVTFARRGERLVILQKFTDGSQSEESYAVSDFR